MSSPSQKISPIALQNQEALSLAYWYKKPLRAFLAASLPDVPIVSQLDWTDHKRNTVSQLVDTLASAQPKYTESLLDLMLATADIRDPHWLKQVEDGNRKYAEAIAALDALRLLVEPYRKRRSEAEEADRRRQEEIAKAAQTRAVSEKLEELKSLLLEITGQTPQTKVIPWSDY